MSASATASLVGRRRHPRSPEKGLPRHAFRPPRPLSLAGPLLQLRLQLLRRIPMTRKPDRAALDAGRSRRLRSGFCRRVSRPPMPVFCSSRPMGRKRGRHLRR
jgi:hypothetical protein